MSELPEILNERQADAQAIQSLLNEIRRLTPMSLLKLADGRVIAALTYDEVSQQDLHARRDKLAAELAVVEALIEAVPVTPPETPQNGVETPAPHQDTTSAPAAPVNVQPQVTPLAGQLPQTEAPAAPVAPVAPVAPGTDPIQ